MLNQNSPEIQFVLRVLREALPLAQVIQKETAGRALTKMDQSPVTIADFCIQALIGYRLAQSFPGDALVAEESSHLLQQDREGKTLEWAVRLLKASVPEATSEKILEWIDCGSGEPGKKFWTLDPIDGTKGFLRGEQYVIAFALIEEGKIKVGALGCPHLSRGFEPDLKSSGSIVIAVRGEGACTFALDVASSEPLRVSKCADPSQARVLASVEPSHSNRDRLEVILKHLGVRAVPILMDSQAKYAVLAGGGGDFFMYAPSARDPGHRMKIWDVAPGAIVVEEAGGKVTDFNGSPLDFSCGARLEKNPGILVTNGLLHPLVLKAIR